MAKLIIIRNSEWNNRARSIGIYVDGQQAGMIANGSTKEFEVAPGLHTIKAKIDWAGSMDVPVMFAENDVKILRLSGFKNGGFIMPITGLCLVLYFLLKMVLFLVVAAPLVLLVLYYLTVGSNKYLVLEQDL